MLGFDRKQQNSVKQLSFNKKNKKKKMFEQTNIKYPTGTGFLFKDENVWENGLFFLRTF